MAATNRANASNMTPEGSCVASIATEIGTNRPCAPVRVPISEVEPELQRPVGHRSFRIITELLP